MSRAPYSDELYEAIAAFGMRRGATVLDLSAADGSAEPFAANGCPLTRGDLSVTPLPFPDERFDLAVSAQTLHCVERGSALAQIYRVLRRGGILAAFWKHLMSAEPIRQIREDVFYSMGKKPVEGALAGGFTEFYAAPFVAQTLRVIPWRMMTTVGGYMEFERSRVELRKALGTGTESYLETLERRLRQYAGGDSAPLGIAFIQYLYLAKKP
jgi:SAM-dependent methyltransferase